MGRLSDFREVVKELKHKKRGAATVNVCPRCGSEKISVGSSFDAYPNMDGIAPTSYICAHCGYKGPLVLEKTRDETV